MPLFDLRRPFNLAFAGAALAACFVNCSPDPPADPDRALIEQLEQRARLRPPRASMAFGYTHQLNGIDPSIPLTFKTTDGRSATLTGAWLIVSAIEAHLCEPSLADRGSWRLLHDLLVPTATAHVPSSATRLGTPFVEDLLSPAGKASIVGEVAPPLGDYCEFFAVVSPADDDVLNLTDLPTTEFEGFSLILDGSFDDAKPFRSTSSRRQAVRFDAIDPNDGAHPLPVDDPQAHHMILLQKTVDVASFRALSSAQLQSSEAADSVLDDLIDTFRVKRFRTP